MFLIQSCVYNWVDEMAVHENVYSCSREEQLGHRLASIHKNVAFRREGHRWNLARTATNGGWIERKNPRREKGPNGWFVLEIRDGLFRGDNAWLVMNTTKPERERRNLSAGSACAIRYIASSKCERTIDDSQAAEKSSPKLMIEALWLVIYPLGGMIMSRSNERLNCRMFAAPGYYQL